jgi:hypothetical protein
MATIIDPTLAENIIQEFRNQNKASAEYALKTPDGLFLNGFFIDRECLESILSDKDYVGIHVYFAKDPDFTGKPDYVYTLTITGTKLNTAPSATTPYVNDGDIYDKTPPCPPYCGSL